MSTPERVASFVPIETIPLPRPLHRFGPAFPTTLAEVCVSAYTPRRGVVLDPLAHPCSAADAVERLDRRAVARSPVALGAWARRVVAQAPSPDDVQASLDRAGESAITAVAHKVAMRELYGSRCGTCRAPVVAEAFLWERDSPTPAKKAFRCGVCAREGRALLIEPTTEEDDERARAVPARGQSYERFVALFGEDRAIGESVAALYTTRNLAAIMATLAAIEASVPAGSSQDVLRLCLVEVLVSGSRLNAVAGHGAPLRIEKGHARRGHAAQSREVNVWLEFERTVRDLCSWLAAEERARGERVRAVAPFDVEPSDADLVLCEAPADDQLGAWAYVGGVICADLRERWHDDGDGRVSARERLMRTMRQALADARKLARDDAPAVVYLPKADLGSLAACALAGAGAGYRLRGVVYQSDALRSGGTDGAAAILDFDRDTRALKDQPAPGTLAIEEAVREGVRQAILARGEPIRTDVAAAAALRAVAEKGLLASLVMTRAAGVSELERFIDHFRSALSDGRRTGIEKTDILGEPIYSLSAPPPDLSPLDDRVEWGVWGLLSSSRDIETRMLLRRTYALFRGDETPDRELVERCIATYGAQSDDGRWRLRDEDALAKRQDEQTALVADLVDAGHRLGFKVHVGRELERRPMPTDRTGRGAVLGDLQSTEERAAVLARVIRGPADALELINCVWYDHGRMVFLWQVEWTARLHHGVVALGETIPDDDRVFRFVALPEERRALAEFKLERSPTLAGAVRRRGWRFVKWGPLRAWATDQAAGLEGLEPVLGLEPAVEQAGQQLVFNW